MLLRYFAACLLVLFFVSESQAAIYKCKDKKGKMTFKDQPCEKHETREGMKAATLGQQSLQGRWLILMLNGRKETDIDFWEFSDNEFYQNLGGHRMAPDLYSVQENSIRLNGYSIQVKSFDGDKMQASMGGANYELRKVSSDAGLVPQPPKKLSSKKKQQVEEFASGMLGGPIKKAALNCNTAVSNGKSWVDSMRSVGKKNYLDGYMTKADYDRSSRELQKFQSSLSVSECNSASGNRKGFYQCLSSESNHAAKCAQTYGY